MPTSPTPNLGFTAPLSGELVSLAPSNFQSIISILDTGVGGPVANRVVVGPLSGLPNPTAQPFGTLYHATDTGIMFLRNGQSTWTYFAANQSVPPVGAIMQYSGTSDPVDPDGTTRWNICDGRAINRTTFATLFTNIGTAYGSGNGSTTFNIPNGQGNVMVGKSGSFTIGSTGGEQNHTLSTTELAVHGHTDSGHGHTDSGHSHGVTTNAAPAPTASGATNSGGGFNTAGTSAGSFSLNTGTTNLANGFVSLSSTGGGGAHNNMQPYVVVNHIIRVL